MGVNLQGDDQHLIDQRLILQELAFNDDLAYIVPDWSDLAVTVEIDAAIVSCECMLTLYLIVSSADNLCKKQFGPRSCPQNVGHDLDPNCLTL